MNKNEVLKNVFMMNSAKVKLSLLMLCWQAETRLVSCLLALVNQSAIRYRL